MSFVTTLFINAGGVVIPHVVINHLESSVIVLIYGVPVIITETVFMQIC